MPNRKKARKPEKTVSKPISGVDILTISTTYIADLSPDAFDNELLLVTERDSKDDLEEVWSKKRKRKGSTIVYLNGDQEYKVTGKPTCLTKVGHGPFYADTMAMHGFYHTKDAVFVTTVKQALIAHPTITRINLYACKSGLPPLMPPDKADLANRVKSKSLDEKRYQDGQLSYAEYFILRLKQSFDKNRQLFPRKLYVVACLGDVKENGGKVGISKNKRQIHPESYHTVCPATALVQIDCDKFLTQYRLCNTATTQLSKHEEYKTPLETTYRFFSRASASGLVTKIGEYLGQDANTQSTEAINEVHKVFRTIS